jgi:Fe-S oxidoreductase
MFYQGYASFDDNFRMIFKPDGRFITRRPGGRRFPRLEDIPNIVRPSMKSMVESMRGCGVGCDFCEVTLRPLRYYPVEKIEQEVEVNVKYGGSRMHGYTATRYSLISTAHSSNPMRKHS